MILLLGALVLFVLLPLAVLVAALILFALSVAALVAVFYAAVRLLLAGAVVLARLINPGG